MLEMELNLNILQLVFYVYMNMTIIFKPLLANYLANQSHILYGPSWEGGTKICINGPGRMTKMTPHPYVVKALKISSTKSLFILKLWMQHLGQPFLDNTECTRKPKLEPFHKMRTRLGKNKTTKTSLCPTLQ